MNNTREKEDEEIHELSKRIGRITNIAQALSDDVTRDIKIIDGVMDKSNHLATGLRKTTNQVGTIFKHEWVKAGKCILFIIFIFALVLHYSIRLGLFRFLYSPHHRSHHDKPVQAAPSNPAQSSNDADSPQPL